MGPGYFRYPRLRKSTGLCCVLKLICFSQCSNKLAVSNVDICSRESHRNQYVVGFHHRTVRVMTFHPDNLKKGPFYDYIIIVIFLGQRIN